MAFRGQNRRDARTLPSETENPASWTWTSSSRGFINDSLSFAAVDKLKDGGLGLRRQWRIRPLVDAPWPVRQHSPPHCSSPSIAATLTPLACRNLPLLFGLSLCGCRTHVAGNVPVWLQTRRSPSQRCDVPVNFTNDGRLSADELFQDAMPYSRPC
jgi:hypothetical protein